MPSILASSPGILGMLLDLGLLNHGNIYNLPQPRVLCKLRECWPNNSWSCNTNDTQNNDLNPITQDDIAILLQVFTSLVHTPFTFLAPNMQTNYHCSQNHIMP